MGQIRCPETAVKDYHSTLRYTPEERTSHQHRGGSLKSRTLWELFSVFTVATVTLAAMCKCYCAILAFDLTLIGNILLKLRV
jgi:hypothetical protein